MSKKPIASMSDRQFLLWVAKGLERVTGSKHIVARLREIAERVGK